MNHNFGRYQYLKSIRSAKPITIVVGPAGSGKTYIACKEARRMLLKDKTFDKCIITRPAIGVDENLGYLPGTLQDKLNPYLYPIYDHFEQASKLQDKLEITPLSFIRGRTFKDSIIIADEMQNSSINQMKTLLTRMGTNSKMIITGDLAQSDYIGVNGLDHFLNKIDQNISLEYINLVFLGKNDIKRHPCINEILNIYNNE